MEPCGAAAAIMVKIMELVGKHSCPGNSKFIFLKLIEKHAVMYNIFLDYLQSHSKNCI